MHKKLGTKSESTSVVGDINFSTPSVFIYRPFYGLIMLCFLLSVAVN